MSEPVLTVEQAEDLAALLIGAIDECVERLRPDPAHREERRTFAVDRERVASDLAGLRDHHDEGRAVRAVCFACADVWPCDDARRYSDGLRRTAELYGIGAMP